MEVFPDQGSNLCLLHWQMDSLPICMEFLRWQHCSDWAQIVRCQRWKMEADVAGEEQWEERNGSCIFTSDDIAQDVLPPLQCTHEWVLNAMLMKSEWAPQIMLLSVSWFGYCSLVVQDTVIVGGWSMWDLSVHFSFATSSESVIISEQKVIRNHFPSCGC